MHIVFIIFLTLSFLVSGINRDVSGLVHVFMFTGLAAGVISLVSQKQKLTTPPNFVPFLLFTFILQVYLIFTPEKTAHFNYSLLFIEGGVLWFIGYNMKLGTTKYLDSFFILPALIYAGLYLFDLIFKSNLESLALQYFEQGKGVGHPQIGNLFSVVAIYLLSSAINGKQVIYDFIFYILALYFLLLSKSRSAVLGILVSLTLYFRQDVKLRKFIYIAIPILASVLIYFSFGKTVLQARVYFAQSLLGFVRAPFGVGMGNFGQISLDFYNSNGSLAHYSSLSHNIFLETLSGVGIFCIPFLYWGFLTIKDILKTKSLSPYGYLFLVLGTIFMIDTTYSIPGMFWLWFVALGMMQKLPVSSGKS